MKQNMIALLAGLSAAALVGCQSKPETPEPKEYTSVPLYMAGQEIPGDSQEKYLTNASVKMYSVGRLVDPGSGTMREAGTVYRTARRIEGVHKGNPPASTAPQTVHHLMRPVSQTCQHKAVSAVESRVLVHRQDDCRHSCADDPLNIIQGYRGRSYDDPVE